MEPWDTPVRILFPFPNHNPGPMEWYMGIALAHGDEFYGEVFSDTCDFPLKTLYIKIDDGDYE